MTPPFDPFHPAGAEQLQHEPERPLSLRRRVAILLAASVLCWALLIALILGATWLFGVVQ